MEHESESIRACLHSRQRVFNIRDPADFNLEASHHSKDALPSTTICQFHASDFFLVDHATHQKKYLMDNYFDSVGHRKSLGTSTGRQHHVGQR